MKKTYSQKPSEVTRRWIVLDAKEATLGRLSTEITKYLIGKYKPTYTPHIDAGDYVVVINAEAVPVTGGKELQKMYYRHSGYPGALKEARLEEVRASKPELVIELAVKGMLPKNKLSPERMKRLKVYAGGEHEHAAQKPEKISMKAEEK